jgi:hypothetical protein
MNAQHGRELTAGGNAIAWPQIARVHEGAELIAQLNVEWNMTFWLEMDREHCLSP